MARRPTMTSLRLFLQVARTLSFSETARSANLSQPALSRTIKLLEEALDVRLFDRDARNVRLTAAGAALMPTVERLTHDFDAAFRELAQTFDGQRGRVVVGPLPSVAATLLPRVIARFRAAHPKVEIVVRENLTAALEQNLQERLLDFTISTAPTAGAEIDFAPLFTDECVLAGRSCDLDAVPDPAPWAVFADLPFIGMETRSSVRMLADSAFAKNDIAVPTQYECTQLATVGGLIAAGLGVSLLPFSTLALLGPSDRIAWRAMQAPQVSRTIGVCCIRGRTLAPAAAALLAMLLEEGTGTIQLPAASRSRRRRAS